MKLNEKKDKDKNESEDENQDVNKVKGDDMRRDEINRNKKR